MERYRSGHNEAVLKTVCPQGHVGSNPTLSVEVRRVLHRQDSFCHIKRESLEYREEGEMENVSEIQSKHI
jgi:hypothetical protein